MTLDVDLLLNADGSISKATFDSVRKALDQSYDDAVDRILAALGKLRPKPDQVVRVQYITHLKLHRGVE